jgi:5-methyltetrahydropteroyltriglutamate--homocysteine methyltransferase
VTRKASHTSVEAAFLARHAPGVFKITMMSASMGGMSWRPGLSDAAYPEPGDLVRDLVALQIQEIEELIGQGVRWIQLDSLGYNQVFDPQFRANTGLAAVPPEAILDALVTADAQIVGAAKRKDPGVTVGMHICRGNNRSAWMSQGSYEPVAERLFSEVGVDRFLLEYDTERAGGFEPAPPWSSGWFRQRSLSWSPRMTCAAGWRRRPSTCQPATWRSARSAGSPRRHVATC